MPWRSRVEPFRRALLLRCPACGGGPVFLRWLRMAPACATCGLRFGRGEPGYWLGAYFLNLVAAETVFAALFGLGFGAMGALIPLTVQEIFGVKAYGSIAGLVNLFTVVSYFAGPILVGAYFDANGDYKMAFLTVAGLFFLGMVTLASARFSGWATAPAGPVKGS